MYPFFHSNHSRGTTNPRGGVSTDTYKALSDSELAVPSWRNGSKKLLADVAATLTLALIRLVRHHRELVRSINVSTSRNYVSGTLKGCLGTTLVVYALLVPVDVTTIRDNAASRKYFV